ncbi:MULTISPECIES: bestrophin-like domain [unclassified Nonomuraea]|uniref:bestrophin-like domain n=1 Tax=unclassified Nonomuraea TaxID=2593643 RepID=UPI0035C2213F
MVAYTLSILAAVGAVALTALVFRRVKRAGEDRDPNGPSAAHAGAMLSAMFLLVFAIAIIVPWTTADAARLNTHAESQSAVDAYWAASDLPGSAPEEVRRSLRDYVTFVMRDEWPLMAEGKMHPLGAERMDDLRGRVNELQTRDGDEEDAKETVLEHISAISTARAQRTADAAATPPEGLLLLTILTGALVIVFPFLAGARPRGLAMLPLVATAALLGFGIYLTWDISHAFAGPLAVGSEAFQGALDEFARIAGGL